MSEIPSTRNGIHHQQHRPAKRSMNPENIQGTETAGLLSISGSEDGTSDTLLKTPYETEESLRKRPRVFSVQQYISESDVNSDGEAMKDYFLPGINASNFKNSGDLVPIGFAKTHKTTKESQIY